MAVEPGDAVMTIVVPIRPYGAFLDGDDTQAEMFDADAVLWVEAGEWDEAAIPARPWIAPGVLMRGAVTVLSGPGSAGKSMLTVAWACGLALNVPVGGLHPRAASRVFVYNVEDDDAEQRRRFSGCLREIGKSPADLSGLVYRLGPHNIGALLAVDNITGRLTVTPAGRELERLMNEHRPDVVFLDPLVELHSADENDNTGIRQVMAWFRSLARRFDCSVVLLHHARKGLHDAAGDPDSLRGASSIVGAARVVLTVLTMDKDEAEALGIPHGRRRDYFRVDGAKSNYAPPGEAEWYERRPHELANGDTAVAAVPWHPTNPLTGKTPLLNRALTVIADGPEPGVRYTASKRGGAARWVGQILVDECDLTEAQARSLVASWLKNGVIVEREYMNERLRKLQLGVVVIDSKRPSE